MSTPAPGPDQPHEPQGTSGPPGTFAHRVGAGARRYGILVLAVLAFLVVRALTDDDGTGDVRVGQCVAAGDGGDVRVVDCSDGSSAGRVVLVERDVFTDETRVRALCAAHGSDRAFTSALAAGDRGTVLCVRP
ncbi:hypothetical protein [Terrabacter sp. NPDC000476]|uniref:hypothetical protein n=1 Tax=Terrabacter sp. NPDC000476 TaxID=3154258 RepID=UPI003326CB9E